MTEQLKEQLAVQREHDERMRSEFKADKQQMQQQLAAMEMKMEQQRVATTAQMEAQRLENDKLRAAAAETRVEAVATRLRDQQLIVLQARLEALSAAKLLTDDELFAVEDVIADSTGSGEASGDDQVTMLLALSARMAMDSAFARQLRRKVVAQ